jgi:hypothetical protein
LAIFNRRRRVPNHFVLSARLLRILRIERADPEHEAKEKTASNALRISSTHFLSQRYLN